jgi:chloramphenicol-sensitive protein RarD
MNKGILYGILTYVLWGFMPLYWKALQAVPASEILAHRMVWSLFFVLALLAYKRHWRWIRPSLGNGRIMLTFFITAILLTINWFTYIWGVNAGFIIETSLGYFINPLVNVLLGFLFLKERLRRGQLLAILIALSGVVYLTISYGAFPWLALTLAITFAFYGLLRKTASLDAAEGLALETAILFLPAVVFLLFLSRNGSSSFANSTPQTTILLMGAGIATGVPLLLFSTAARRITLTNIGLLQYLAPTIQFLLGVLVFKEIFTPTHMVAFSFIWLALIIYTIESLFFNRRQAALIPLKVTEY